MSKISSSISNIVNTIYRANGSQAIQESRLVAQGIGGIGRNINQASDMSDRFNRQWRAIGTTMRYAIAGGVVFGLARMVSQLKDVQQQLGLMQAIGQPAGGGSFSNNQISQLGNQLQKSAQDALTPINEINDATINLLSTVQNVPGSEIPGIITNIGQAAKLSQTPIEDLTKAATTMNIAFGRNNNAQTIAQFNRMWFALISTAPGGVTAAPEIANQLPQLASMFTLGRGPVSGKQSQSQMFADVLGVLTTGSPPSTGLRGLNFLINSMILPTSNKKALAGIGITPESIAKEGIQVNLMRLLRTITNTGNINAIKGLDDTSLDQLDAQGAGLPGIPASEMARLRALIPRIHGQRAAVILAQRLQPTAQSKSLNQSETLFTDAQNNMLKDTNELARAWKNFADRSQLQAATIAIGNMRLEVAQALEPVLNLGARGITKLGKTAAHHRTAVQIAVLGALGVGATVGAARFTGLTSLLRGGGNGIARAEAIRDIGSVGAGNSVENPLYVIVVGQLFGGKNGAASTAETSAEGAAAKQARKLFPWFTAPAARAALGSPGGLVLGGTVVGSALVAREILTRNKNDPRAAGVKRYPLIDQFTSVIQGLNPAQAGHLNPYWLSVFQQYMKQQISPSQLNKMLGRADVYMEIDLKQDGKVTTKRMQIPLKLFEGGKYPSTRGKPGMRNG